MSRKKVRNFEYQQNKKRKRLWENKVIRTLFFVVFGVLFVAFIVLACIEPTLKNKLVIENTSGHTITSMKIWYEDANGNTSKTMSFENLKQGKKISDSIKPLELDKFGGETWITLQIAFEEGGEALLQTGHFLNDFEGKISLIVSDAPSGDVKIHVRAGEGLFDSTAVTDCDDIYYINPKNGYIE